MQEFDEHKFCGELCSLMDRIEAINTDFEVGQLLKQRFEIAERNGLRVMFLGGDASAQDH